jgi:L-alanine-DL-glutamate epimerase-like enolase superfamily enzyme
MIEKSRDLQETGRQDEGAGAALSRRNLIFASVGSAAGLLTLPMARDAQADKQPQKTREMDGRADGKSGQGQAVVQGEILRLKLRHTWTTVMSSSTFRETILCRYTRDGVTGLGEGAPIKRYAETAQSALSVLESSRAFLQSADPWRHESLLSEFFRRVPGEFALKSAVTAAIMDYIGQRLSIPLYRYFGLDPDKAPITTMSIGIDSPELTRKKVEEAADFPVLKVKVGLDSDEATIQAVRSVTKKPLRVDANEGWKSKEVALKKINWLADQGVELIEQPLPAAMFEETRWLRGKARIPIFADESCLHPEDIPRLAEAYDGVNIKLDKCGGIFEALRMIHVARAHKLKVMIGCMIESAIAIAAAAQLSPLCDYADLDGAFLIENNTHQGMTVEHGKIKLPDRPGLGLLRTG